MRDKHPDLWPARLFWLCYLALLAIALAMAITPAKAQPSPPALILTGPFTPGDCLEANTRTTAVSSGSGCGGGGGGVSSVAAANTSVVTATAAGAVTVSANTPQVLTWNTGSTVSIGGITFHCTNESVLIPTAPGTRIHASVMLSGDNGSTTNSGYIIIGLYDAADAIGYFPYWRPSVGEYGNQWLASGTFNAVGSQISVGGVFGNGMYIWQLDVIADGPTSSNDEWSAYSVIPVKLPWTYFGTGGGSLLGKSLQLCADDTNMAKYPNPQIFASTNP